MFQNLDVDQIVMDYQSSGTPRPSVSKFPPITPVVKANDTRPEETCLPPELCVNCSHGFKVQGTFLPVLCVAFSGRTSV